MKKFIKNLLVLHVAVGALLFGGAGMSRLLTSSPSAAYAYAKEEVAINGCKSACLMDYHSGQILYSLNETKRMPIASVCKVMTLSLVFDAISEGKLNENQKITVSKHAASMGGSQVFLEAGKSYALSDLIKSVIVCSANDSCVALSEAVCGSEELFVAHMNERAKEWDCINTSFVNCTGLPKEGQYSCAQDVAVMFSHLIANEKYFSYSKVWLDDFIHPDNRVTSITNTNKLIRRYSACDGGKTGFTNEAGFCLAATAIKDNLRLISVVLGGETSDARFDGCTALFDYGFANYRNKVVLDKDIAFNEPFEIVGGKKQFICGYPQKNGYIFSKGDQTPNVTFEVTDLKVKAPISNGDVIGKVEIYNNGVLYETIDVVAGEDVLKANFLDSVRRTAEHWPL